MREISLSDAVSPLVMAVDIGSSSVRALLYDALGQQIQQSEHHLPHSLATTLDGGSIADPDHLVTLVYTCIDHTLASAGNRRADIAAVAMTTFWHSLMGLTRTMTPSTPVLMWADKRSGTDASALARTLDAQALHSATGCRLHSSYWPAKLQWLKRVDPDAFGRTATWVSFADYLSWSLHGELATSVSMGSGTGMLRTDGASWHADLLDLLDLPPSSLPALVDRDVPYPAPREKFRTRWPELVDVPWFPSIGDGATANVGSGCIGRDRIALTIGTSGAMRTILTDELDYQAVPQQTSPKLWHYRLDRRNRVIGGALSNGGNITRWLAELSRSNEFGRLTEHAKAIAPDGHGLTVLPFFAGERSPSWNDEHTGTITGLTLNTTNGDLFRAFLEATAYRFASIYEDLTDVVDETHEIHANGSAALGSPLWLQILADTLVHRVDALDAEAEASARGAAICALESIGALPALRSALPAVVTGYLPNHDYSATYAAGRSRLERLESAMDAFFDAERARHT